MSATALREEAKNASEERTLARIAGLESVYSSESHESKLTYIAIERYGTDKKTGQPVLLRSCIADLFAHPGQYKRLCPIGRCTDVLYFEGEVNHHFWTEHPEVFNNSDSSIECPHLGCSLMFKIQDLEEHLRGDHLGRPIDHKDFTCLMCAKTCTSAASVRNHLQNGACKRRPCMECKDSGRSYKAENIYERREHELRHLRTPRPETDEQPKAKKQNTTRK
jgi:hypothetical protein